MTIEFDSREYKGMFIDDGMRKLLSFIEQLVNAHNELTTKVNSVDSYASNSLQDILLDFEKKIIELTESAATQAREIAELRAKIGLLNVDVGIEDESIEFPASELKMRVLEKENYQMKEDIRDFVKWYEEDGKAPLRNIYKNLKRHLDE